MSVIRPARQMTNQHIEQRAAKLLADFQRATGTQLMSPPVPIQQIVESHLDLHLMYDEIPQDEGERILAYIDPAKRTICLNTAHLNLFNDVIGTEAFTLAHEAGHWELHIFREANINLTPRYTGTGERFLCRANRNDPREYQANRFAAALLMPRYLVLAAVKGKRLNRWDIIQELAGDFGVSKEAFKIRLETLGLIEVVNKSIQPLHKTKGIN